MIFIRRVEGESMLPVLLPGKIVFVKHTRSFKPGQVVVAFMNGREVIKRIERIERGQIFLVGDNELASTDSRTLGPVVDSYIEGVVFWPRTRLTRKNL